MKLAVRARARCHNSGWGSKITWNLLRKTIAYWARPNGQSLLAYGIRPKSFHGLPKCCARKRQCISNAWLAAWERSSLHSPLVEYTRSRMLGLGRSRDCQGIKHNDLYEALPFCPSPKGGRGKMAKLRKVIYNENDNSFCMNLQTLHFSFGHCVAFSLRSINHQIVNQGPGKLVKDSVQRSEGLTGNLDLHPRISPAVNSQITTNPNGQAKQAKQACRRSHPGLHRVLSISRCLCSLHPVGFVYKNTAIVGSDPANVFLQCSEEVPWFWKY